jgi:hypothetical protein
LSYRWWIYLEAGRGVQQTTIHHADERRAELRLPEQIAGAHIHVILEVTDHGQPHLISYRRVVVDVK